MVFLMSQSTKPIEFLAEVFANGKITIPKTVRKTLDIADGDIVKVVILEIIKEKQEVTA